MPREWDAASYDSLPLPHLRWGRRVLDRLDLRETDTVLDAGAGTGRDAAAVLARLPRGRVVAVDGSARMLARLAENLAADRDRVQAIHADLTTPFGLAEPVDAIYSVATFHWVADHDALFANLAAHLRPGGQFVAECGGAGNVATVEAAVAAVLGPTPSHWHFAGVDETAAALARAGFTDVEVDLRPDPARPAPGDLLDYLTTVVLGGHLDRLPPAEHADFVRAVAARLPEPVIDYVRLNLRARLA